MPVGYGHSRGDKRHHCGLDLCRSSEIASSGSTSSFPDFRTVSVPYITFYNDLEKLLNVESGRQGAVYIVHLHLMSPVKQNRVIRSASYYVLR